MIKVFKMEDVDCANCAMKMEEAVNRLPEIKKATLNFMLQKLTVETDEEITDALRKKIEKACKKIDRSCSLID